MITVLLMRDRKYTVSIVSYGSHQTHITHELHTTCKDYIKELKKHPHFITLTYSVSLSTYSLQEASWSVPVSTFTLKACTVDTLRPSSIVESWSAPRVL